MSWKDMEISSDENNSLVTDIREPSIQEKPMKNKFKLNNSCRRFTDEQIKSLESIFSLETKLEPRKKQQVAKDLGLEPRQVAIWFQNRRARGKSKQIEREYKVLRANYDSLHMKLDELRRENFSLEMQLKELNDALENQGKVSLVNTDLEAKDYTTTSNEGGQNSKYRYIGTAEEKEDDEIVGWGEEEEEEEEEEKDISLLRSATTTWLDMSCDGLFDKSFCGSNWWET